MPRLRNKKTRAVVSVPDVKVERLGPEWELADKPATAKKAAASPSKSSK